MIRIELPDEFPAGRFDGVDGILFLNGILSSKRPLTRLNTAQKIRDGNKDRISGMLNLISERETRFRGGSDRCCGIIDVVVVGVAGGGGSEWSRLLSGTSQKMSRQKW